MHSNPTQYDLIAPTTLDAALQILADSPDNYTPIAGGTELMVALGAGRLAPRNLLSINHLRELRFIEVSPDTVTIGSGTTFSDSTQGSAQNAQSVYASSTVTITIPVADLAIAISGFQPTGNTESGTLTVSSGGKTKVIRVSGAPNIYTVASNPTPGNGTVTIKVSPGLQAYSFTFG